MARLLTAGFETQVLGTTQAQSAEGESLIKNGTVAINTTKPRSGAACAECAASGANYVQHLVTTTLGRKYFYRFAFRLSALPGATMSLWRAGDATATVMELAVTKEGKLEAFDGVSSTHPAGSSTIEAERWYVLEVMLQVNAAGKGKFSWRLNGVALGAEEQEVETRNTGITFTRQGNISSSTAVVYLDDIAHNDDQGASENSWCGANRKIVMLKPKEDVSRAGFTGGGGATTGLFDAVNNTPPTGAATPGTNASQIGSANANTTDNLVLKTSAYSDPVSEGGGGLAAGDVVKVLTGQLRGAQGSVTGRGLGLTFESNPAVAEKTGFNNAEVAGADPAGWRTISQPLENPQYAPAVTKAEGVKLKVRKSVSTTDNVMADLVGVVVEYEPMTEVPLQASSGVASATLALQAQTVVPLNPASGVATATASVQAATSLSLEASGAASATLGVKASTSVPLNASSGSSSASIAVAAPTAIPLGASTGTATDSLAVSVGQPLALSPASGKATATLTLLAQPVLALGPASGVATASLEVRTPIPAGYFVRRSGAWIAL